MIPVEEAFRLVLETVPVGAAVTCPLRQAAGRVLRVPVKADRPSPPYDRVVMDGAALSFDTWAKGVRAFPVQDTVAAGQPPPALADPGHAVRVMTGGVLPPGCDMVVPVEWFAEKDGSMKH